MTDDDVMVALDILQDGSASETTAWALAVLELYCDPGALPRLSRAKAGTHTVTTHYRWGSFPPRIEPHLSLSGMATGSRAVSLHGTRGRSASGCNHTNGLAYSLTGGGRRSLSTRGCLL
jgi:hypothetical protein